MAVSQSLTGRDVTRSTRDALARLARNTLGLASLVLLMTAGVLVAAVTMAWSPNGVGMRASNACWHLWSRVSLRLFGVRVWVRGAQHLAGPPAVLVANHRSHLDVPVLGCVLRQPVCTVYKRSLERIPILSWALWLSQSVGIDRADAASSRQQLERVSRRLGSGRNILVFPEGHRSAGASLLPFKKGAVALALEQRVDLIPITIVGTDTLYPPGQLMVETGDALVIIHPRVSTTTLNWQDRGVLNQRMMEMVSGAFKSGLPVPSRLLGSVRMA